MRLAAVYAAFAVVSIAVNLLTQGFVTVLDPTPWSFWTALFAGTGAGLVVKYLLDKQYIFRAHHITRPAELGRNFLRYASTGLATTAVFWGIQVAFHLGFPSWPDAKYAGGAIGLTLGFVWKYHLDRRYVFAKP
jgi:putative flippase GtrA